jgi:hypothetical protein
MSDKLLIEILNKLNLDSTPPLVVYTDIGANITWIIYRQTIINGNGLNTFSFPILKIVSTSTGGYTQDTITKGLMINDNTFNPLVYNASLITALNATNTI